MNSSVTSTNSSEHKNPITLAAIVTDDSRVADQIVDSVIEQLQRQHYSLAGLRQKVVDDVKRQGGCGVRLQSVASGQLHRMTQDLGVGSTSCNIDTGAMAQLVEAQKNELNIDTDLLIVNRFGKRESEGAGFCSVFERALELGIPVLTVVKSTWQDSWNEYGGEYVTSLPADEAAVLAWCQSLLWINRPVEEYAMAAH